MKMTDEDVLRLANEVDLGLKLEIGDTDFHVYRRFAALCAEQGALDMRERCAKMCDEYGRAVADHIRALTVGET